MATIFSLGPKGADDLCPIKIRVQARTPHVDVKQQTPLRISEKVWNTKPGTLERSKYCRDEKIKKVFDDVENIRMDIYKKLDAGVALSSADVKEIVNFYVYRELREKEAAEAEEAARLEAEANRVTLRKFIEQFRKDIKAGKRLTDKGTVYAPGTINAINQACERLKKFEKKMKREYDFDDIDMNFYRDYTAYLNKTRTRVFLFILPKKLVNKDR